MCINVIIMWYDVFGRFLVVVVIVIFICLMSVNKFIILVWIGCWKNFEFIIMIECMVVIWYMIFINRGINFFEFWIVFFLFIFLGFKIFVFNFFFIIIVCFGGFWMFIFVVLMFMYKFVFIVGFDSFWRSCVVFLLICNKICFLS